MIYDTEEKRNIRGRVLWAKKLKYFSDKLKKTGNKMWCIIANKECGFDADYNPGIDDGEPPHSEVNKEGSGYEWINK